MGVCLIAAKTSLWLEPTFWFGLLMAAIALGVVIFVHELGHFLAAKACKVKCLKFYVGFDPPWVFTFKKFTLRLPLPSAFWKRKWGETEYGIGVIPLGGYVRMLGQDDNPAHESESPVVGGNQPAGDGSAPPQLDPRNYQSKKVWQRMIIISAGVVMNVIFAYIFALTAVYVGVKYTPCLVAHTQPGDPAWRENVLPGDEIVEINGLKNPRFSDLQQMVLLSNAAEGLKLVIRRPGVQELIHMTLKPDKDYVSPRELPRLGVAMEAKLSLNKEEPTSLASPARALPEATGFRGDDKITAVGGQPVRTSIDFEKLLVQNVDKPLAFTVERLKPGQPANADPVFENVTVTVPTNPWRDLGLTMTMGPINAVRENSPATRAKSDKVSGGIEKGDKIVAIDGQPAGDPITLPMRLRDREGKEVTVTVERSGGQKIDFTTTLDVPTWSAESMYADSPAALLSLGVTYPVVARVAAPPSGAAAGKGIEVGDEVVQVVLAPQENPQTDEEKDEAERAAEVKIRPIALGPDKPAWPSVMALLQHFSPKTGVQLKLKNGKSGSEEPRTVTLNTILSKDLFNPDRGLLLQPNLKPLQIHSFGEALDFAWRETKGSLMQVVLFLKKMVSGRVSVTAMGGPITIFRAAAHYGNQGLGALLLFMTLLSANLAVLNFLPIPILDGGHMMFLAWEGIFRRPMPMQLVYPATLLGAALLLTLMVLTTVMDIQRLFNWL